MKTLLPITPFKSYLNFDKLIAYLEQKSKSENVRGYEKAYYEELIETVEPLRSKEKVFSGFDDLQPYKKQIEQLLHFLFPESLKGNEIKAISFPFDSELHFPTNRFQNILKQAGDQFKFQIRNLKLDFLFQMHCVFILKTVYNVKIDFSRPFFIEIPDASGLIRTYKVTYNVDFIDVMPNENTKFVTQEEIDRLLSDSKDLDFWKEMFPPESYTLKGFSVVNLVDVTQDDAISAIKTALLTEDNSEYLLNKFTKIFRVLFNVPDIQLGFTRFDGKKNTLGEFDFFELPNFTLDNNPHKDCKTGLCPSSYEALIKKKTFYVVSSVDAYFERSGGNFLSTSLKNRNIKSCILAPITDADALIGVLEVVSYQKNALNDINVFKLEGVTPYIASTLSRKINMYEDRLKVVIQNECTSLHSSVYWAFEEEAKKFIEAESIGLAASFRDIKFKDVYPIYGQLDIIGSSDARNEAVRKDLGWLIETSKSILKADISHSDLYKPILHKLDCFKKEINYSPSNTTEQALNNYLTDEVVQSVKQIEKHMPETKDLKLWLDLSIDGFKDNQRNRDLYDNSIKVITRKLSKAIDTMQKEAQGYYKHLFERFKTDGIDFTCYVGQSIQPNDPFSSLHLKNIKIWQLKTLCELDRLFYKTAKKIKSNLEVASLILAYSSPITIRYRIDEKRFDIDGSYNARYEVIKKRIDKSYKKNTRERIVEKNKLVIVYATPQEEYEYVSFIEYLQHLGFFNDVIERFEIEPLQGITGLKAIRVGIKYD